MDIVRTQHSETEEYTFFQVCIEHSLKLTLLRHKTNFYKYQRTEIIQCMFLGHCGNKVEINKWKITSKCQNIWKLINTLCVTHE